MKKIFNDIQNKKAKFILEHENAKLSELSSSDIKNLRVAWSYYSGKIEGNTYTYVETEALLKDDITATKKYDDAKMLTNLHNTFTTSISEIQSGRPFDLNERTIKTIHSELTDGLVNNSERGIFRKKPVGITSTDYSPPKEEHEIIKQFNSILLKKDEYNNPLEQAVFLHCNIARIQPFIDGNKRTSRMVESMVLMQNNVVPVFSTKDEDIVKYRDGIVHFYETENYSKYSDYFLNKQIERINKVSLDSAPKYNIETNEITKKKVLSPEEILSKAIYKNHEKEVKELLGSGVKPNKSHLQLMKEMEGEKMLVKPEIEQAIKAHFPSKGQSKGMSI